MSEVKVSYRGDGVEQKPTPSYSPIVDLHRPEDYVADQGLVDAVNVAVTLGMPLLVTGEPGTGKTALAKSVAHEVGAGKPLEFSAKTTSTAQDLFYRYDALRHFRDSRFEETKNKPITDYIDFEALGIATLLSMPRELADRRLPKKYHGIAPRRSVVLIDEIDKAPRDLPNDILREIETMSFTVRESGETFPGDSDRIDARYRPIVILTSNSEKTLPNAFLRRCVYYHIPAPTAAQLEQIVAKRFRTASVKLADGQIKTAVELFEEIRSIDGLRKKPATAELLMWLQLLTERNADPALVRRDRRAADLAASVLTKTSDDADQVRAKLLKKSG
jgi:MoxR-like ATPase